MSESNIPPVVLSEENSTDHGGGDNSNAAKRVSFERAAAADPCALPDHSSGVPAQAAVADAGEHFESKHWTPTDSTLGAVSDADTHSSDGGQYEVIEYDHLEEIEPTIEDNTPAAEALRANAGVHVSKMGKAARALHMQALRKVVKSTAGRRRSGYVRGKPPRLPPHTIEEEGSDYGSLEAIIEGEGETADVDDELRPKLSDENAAIPDSVVAGTAEAGKKVLGSVDPHDMLKLLRWRRKKKEIVEKQSRKSYVKGKVIDGQHELYTLSIAVMIGVRTSISKTNTILNQGPGKRWVQAKDFRSMEKYEFRPKGGTLPPHQLSHTFKFKDYAPVAFAYLRRMYGVNEFDFLLSVCGNANFIEFISNAKSGQFFFYSSDGKYMIKTMTNAESKYLRRMLPQYFRHCASNPNTMITRFFGMYRVKLYHLRRNVKFVVMSSVYYTDKYLQTFYDLKGSSVGREARPGEAVKKDNDLRKGLPDDALALPSLTRTAVRGQIVQDTKFLTEMEVMDYSMLVGVHHIPPAQVRNSASIGGWSSVRRRAKSEDLDYTSDSLRYSDASPSAMSSLDIFDKPAAVIRQTSGGHRPRQPSDQIGAFFLDDGLDDDDSSYILDSSKRPGTDTTIFSKETEMKKLATIEKLYWPFHRLFDIHGYRLIKPVLCPKCGCRPCGCSDDFGILKGYNIPKFLPPLSERKDGGLEMDTTGMGLPKHYRGPQGDQLYEGKIFYMGISDILQEYNQRKRMEAQYRYMYSGGRQEASCIPPKSYGDRFVAFFDEYSHRDPDDDHMGIEADLSGSLERQNSVMAEL